MSESRQRLRRAARDALGPLAPAVRGLLDAPQVAAAWRRASQLLPLREREPRVAYMLPDFPLPPGTREGIALGGAGKIVYLAEAFPHSYPACDVLFTVSSVHHRYAPLIVRRARARGVRVVLNQNGVYYRAWYGPGWKEQNRPLAAVHRLADHVVYQSEFCRRCAEAMLGPAAGSTSVLYNPVDLQSFRPATRTGDGLRILAIAPRPRERERLTTILHAMTAIRRRMGDVALTIAGWDSADPGDAESIELAHRIARSEGLPPSAMRILPRFSREHAPAVIRGADALLHPVYNDASPNIVVEAMACGLPVVFSASGGVPELVGEAGVGVPAPLDFERVHLPDAEALAEAAVLTLGTLDQLSRAARARAEGLFGLDRWIETHRRIFRDVTAR